MRCKRCLLLPVFPDCLYLRCHVGKLCEAEAFIAELDADFRAVGHRREKNTRIAKRSSAAGVAEVD